MYFLSCLMMPVYIGFILYDFELQRNSDQLFDYFLSGFVIFGIVDNTGRRRKMVNRFGWLKLPSLMSCMTFLTTRFSAGLLSVVGRCFVIGTL